VVKQIKQLVQVEEEELVLSLVQVDKVEKTAVITIMEHLDQVVLVVPQFQMYVL